ncbi:phosphatidylserine decarboxylase [Sphingomonas sp. AP4-R1]|uniref:phosphatidylserine decarboxylase n=1 Tax=Sphingomonas sp. AP4-R1 TaxID=2735134 RepID=UPI001493977E|nr:phosphatidylserine decarboxylase [Sphingomonas sp. AP4-R1]QJU59569.1 phosphatidylserine decarboxylase [Sphingomonas sp. AP4-R1]
MSSLDTRPDTTPSAQWRWPSVHPEGRKFALIAAAITLLVFWFVSEGLGWICTGITIWVLAFFRDPIRSVPQGAGLIVAPADGLITMIERVPPPRELVGDDALSGEPLVRVSIFMSVFDVHINRAPITGTIARVVYISGKFLNASLDKASEENERQHFLVEGADGTRIGFTQIAGLVARRIVPFVKPGDIVAVGQRVGLIRFGSRVDVYLPAGTAPKVALGQRSIAGETILGRLGDGEGVTGVAQ